MHTSPPPRPPTPHYRKDKDKITHHEQVLLADLMKLNAENIALDYSCTYVPPPPRPKDEGDKKSNLLDQTEWVCEI